MHQHPFAGAACLFKQTAASLAGSVQIGNYR
jgi:hypothetical protein